MTELEKIKAKRDKLLLAVKKMQDSNRCYLYKPYNWQENMRGLIATKNTVVVPAPNKIGKTGVGANIVVSWALGYEPWSPMPAGHPDAVAGKGGKWYRKSSLGIRPPVQIRISGEDWTSHVGEVIVPELKKWAPAGEYTTSKNNMGVEYSWKWKNGSTFEIMTYSQSDDLYEAWLGHGWWADEPPPKTKYNAMARGLFLTKGKILMTMTPLKEAWVLDDLVLSGRSDVGIVEGLNIMANEDLVRGDKATLADIGLNDEQMEKYFELLLYKNREKEEYVQDKGLKAVSYIKELVPGVDSEKLDSLMIARFIRDTPIDMIDSRIFGKFKSLVGLVLKDFKTSVHVIEPFKVPLDWPVVAQIDLHLSKPHAVGFFATDPQGKKYAIDEIWENMSPEALADEIVRRKKANSWRLEKVEIDPLSKGDNSFVKNRMGNVSDSFTLIKNRLAPHGILLEVASKDKESGVRNLQDWLRGVNGMPIFYLFDTLKKHLHQIQRWVFDDDGKPKKEEDDFPECMYRFTLMNVVYTSPALINGPIDCGDRGCV